MARLHIPEPLIKAAETLPLVCNLRPGQRAEGTDDKHKEYDAQTAGTESETVSWQLRRFLEALTPPTLVAMMIEGDNLRMASLVTQIERIEWRDPKPARVDCDRPPDVILRLGGPANLWASHILAIAPVRPGTKAHPFVASGSKSDTTLMEAFLKIVRSSGTALPQGTPAPGLAKSSTQVVKAPTLVVVRHGEYNSRTGSLDFDGRQQILRLSEKLASHVTGKKVVVIASSAPRAEESARFLVRDLKLEVEPHINELLWSEHGRDPRLAPTLALIQSLAQEADVVIVVTHLEYTGTLTGYWARHVLQKQVAHGDLGRGEAWVLEPSGSLALIRR